MTSDVYCETFQSLRRSIKNKTQELLTESVVLLHDNERKLVSRITHTKWAKCKLKQLNYIPYSPDMSPCDFHVFGLLKNI